MSTPKSVWFGQPSANPDKAAAFAAYIAIRLRHCTCRTHLEELLPLLPPGLVYVRFGIELSLARIKELPPLHQIEKEIAEDVAAYAHGVLTGDFSGSLLKPFSDAETLIRLFDLFENYCSNNG
jgi:hypothetical protein